MKAAGSSREKLLFHLKTKGPQTAAELARRLAVTPVAVRQHLDALGEDGLVEFQEERRSRGRPARRWSLTEAGHGEFPEGYAELTVDLLGAMRDAFGEDALSKLVAARTRNQLATYRERIGPARALEARVAGLARVRDEDGYMAEWKRAKDGSFLLVENHCPVCAAAELCQGLCAGELELFQDVLGDGVTVEREEHLLDGARRCSYRIAKAPRRGR